MRASKPAVARIAYDLVPEPKEWMEIEGGHFGLLYYPSKLFDKASSAQCRFLRAHLAGSRKRGARGSYQRLTHRSRRRRKLRG